MAPPRLVAGQRMPAPYFSPWPSPGDWVTAQEYLVRLDVFEGPLDLLLHLIEKRELDITAVSLAEVADQYIDYLSHADPDPDALADFLIIACKLLVLKSFALFPQPVASAESEEIATDLTQRLIEYRAFKRAAEALRAFEDSGQRCYPRTAVPQPVQRAPLPEGLTLADLAQALQRALSRLPAQPADPIVPRPVFSVAEKAQLILAQTKLEHRVSFSSLITRATCRAEAVAMFLAVLELLRSLLIDAYQEHLFGDIVLSPRPPQNGYERQQHAGGVDEHVADLGMAVGDVALV